MTSPASVPADRAEFPVDGFKDEINQTVPDIEVFEPILDPEHRDEQEKSFLEIEQVFQQSKADLGTFRHSLQKIDLQPDPVFWHEASVILTFNTTEEGTSYFEVDLS